MKPTFVASQLGSPALEGAPDLLVSAQQDRISRIERVAIRMFGVSNCIISFGQLAARFGKGERSMVALEAAFCDSFGFPNDPLIVNDPRVHPQSAANPAVIGPPYIRFYAVQPVVVNYQVVGAIFLIDYAVRQYQQEEFFLLGDLAGLVEQALQVDTLQHAQEDLARQNRSLRRDSMIDPLLGTWNRTAIVRSLTIEALRCKTSDKPLSLAMVGMDNYADLKERFGLHAAEAMLIKMVSRVRSCIRPFDALGRYGSEEFLVVLPGASHVVIQAVTERIRNTVLAYSETIDGQSITVSVCVGTVSTDLFAEATSEELMTKVVQALHQAKKIANNSVVHAVSV